MGDNNKIFSDIPRSKFPWHERETPPTREEIEREILERGAAFLFKGIVEDNIPPDIRQMAENLNIPTLSESVWVNGFQEGFKLAMRYAALKKTDTP